MLLLLCALCIPFFLSPLATGGPQARAGAVSFAATRDFSRSFALGGNWRMDWKTPLPELNGAPPKPFAIRVPGFWAGQKTSEGVTLPNGGRGVYSLTISGLPPGDYRIYIPTLYGASQVRYNGRVVSSEGAFSDGANRLRSRMQSQEFAFYADGSPGLLEIEVEAEGHNGFETAPVIGRADTMRRWMSLRWSQEMLFQVSLTVLAAFSLTLFLYRREDRPSLFAALACLCFIPSTMFVGFDNMILMVFPAMDSRLMLLIVDVLGSAALLSVLFYVQALFGRDGWPHLFKLVTGIVAGFLSIQLGFYLFAQMEDVSHVNRYSLVVQIAGFIYILALLCRAALRKRDGAVPFLIGLAAFFLTVLIMSLVAYGLVPVEHLVGYDFVAFGVLVMLFSHLIVIAERWSQTIHASEAMNAELRQLLEVNSSITSEVELETLLQRIVGVNTRILRAERSSLFLYDPERRDLWSLVAEGMETREIRIPSDTGIAGAAFTQGKVVAIADAYSDPRFNPAIDAQTGFTTRSILAMPVVARDGRKLGVMQALNRIDGGGFDESDVARMAAFAAQAAISIDNATLFSEVVSARNYSESVLRSMNNGVVTIDRTGKFTKLNNAACAILGITPEAAETHDWASYVANDNPHVLEEVRTVAATGIARTMLDTDVKTVAGGSISANLSIVPLMGEERQEGLLLIIDDITQGKRLEGAMRRFMTQEVMDQVLGQADDALFGTACRASVLFADIRNFTTMAETLTPRQTVDMLNEIFTELFEAVSDARGVLDKYIGDAVMAVFGAPLSSGIDAENAVRAAMRMQQMMAAINTRRASRDEAPLRLGIGIATGDVVAGTVGSPKRMDYTVIGDSVNLAARLQDLTKTYNCDLIVCERTAELAASVTPFREIDRIQVKGRVTQERIFSTGA